MPKEQRMKGGLALIVALGAGLCLVYLVAVAGYTSVQETAPCARWRVLTFQCPGPDRE